MAAEKEVVSPKLVDVSRDPKNTSEPKK